MQTYAIIYVLKINTKDINIFRKKYDPSWKIIASHITLFAPISQVSEKELINHIDSTIKNTNSFPIHLTGLTITADNHLFLLVKEGNEKIVTLYNELYSGILISYQQTYFPFIPHLTLGVFQTKDNHSDDELYKKALIEAENMKLDITSTFDSLFLIKGDGINPAQVIQEFNLK